MDISLFLKKVLLADLTLRFALCIAQHDSLLKALCFGGWVTDRYSILLRRYQTGSNSLAHFVPLLFQEKTHTLTAYYASENL